MSRPKPHIIVLGAGPAGLGAAYRLRLTNLADVTVAEQNDRVGGNAGSFEIAGQRLDYGSHRLHPSCDPAVLGDIRGLLGPDLVERPRHGRIRLEGRWIGFPLRPFDLALKADRRFAVGVGRDFLSKPLRGRAGDGASFGAVLKDKLGPTICERFYFPYARKIWGCEPDELSAMQAKRRVAADSPLKLLRKVFGRLPGVKPLGFQHFLYPRQGFGQISEAFAHAAEELGAELLLGWRAQAIRFPADKAQPIRVDLNRKGKTRSLEGQFLWSTIPVTVLARIASPEPPAHVRHAAEQLEFRGMVLVYLTLEVQRFSEYDAHYFPGEDVLLTRLSEPKNYSGSPEPRGRTTLCAEIPCSTEDAVWKMTPDEIAGRLMEDLALSGIPLPSPATRVEVRKLRHAYPIYLRGYEQAFSALDHWAQTLAGLLSFGRQGLFAHDNTHHALHMAYSAVDCLGPEGFDAGRWRECRRSFERHVVED